MILRSKKAKQGVTRRMQNTRKKHLKLQQVFSFVCLIRSVSVCHLKINEPFFATLPPLIAFQGVLHKTKPDLRTVQ